MNFTHDTKFSDIPAESFLRACTLEDGMAVLFNDGEEYGVAIFDTTVGRCRNADKHRDYKRALDSYLSIVGID